MPGSEFHTTSWTLIRTASGDRSGDSRAALAALCQKYWHPVYSFVRRRGYDREQSQDLTQGFFALLIEKNYLMDPDRMLRLSQAIGDPNVFDATGLVHLLPKQQPYIGGAVFERGVVPVINFAEPISIRVRRSSRCRR